MSDPKGESSAVDVAAFLKQLARAKILSSDDQARVADEFASLDPSADCRRLADLLVHRGLLTNFQAAELRSGRGGSLVVGEYMVLDRIGQGGMGVVYKARHRTMGRVAAIKLLNRATTGSAEAVVRFRREIEAAATLDHPNIVTAFDAGDQDGRYFLAMELVEGIDLQSMLLRDGALPTRLAIDVILQAARGLAHAHDRNIVHRDVKPENLLLGDDGILKIMDLGVAQLRPDATKLASISITRTGSSMGTPDYIAPEQIVDAKSVDHRADIFSLGCTLFCLLQGHPPFCGESPIEKAQGHEDDEIPPLDASRPDVPRRLDSIYRKMTARDREHRFASMDEVIFELEAVAATDLVDASQPEFDSAGADAIAGAKTIVRDAPSEVSAAPLPPRLSSHRRAALLWGALGMALLLALAWIAILLRE